MQRRSAVMTLATLSVMGHNLPAQVPDDSPRSVRTAPVPADPAVPAAPAAVAQDSRLLIAQALSMAIEGDRLQGLALQGVQPTAYVAVENQPDIAGTTAAAPPIVNGRRAPGAVTGTSRDPDAPNSNSAAGAPRVGEAGTGTSGSPAGDAGSGLSTYGRYPTTTATERRTVTGGPNSNSATDAPRAGDAGTGTTGSPAGDAGSGLSTYGRYTPRIARSAPATTAAATTAPANVRTAGTAVAEPVPGRPTATQLGQHSGPLLERARIAFDSSERLLRQAKSADPETERFYRAVDRYVNTLRSLNGASNVATDPNGAEVTATTPRAVVPPTPRADTRSVALINLGLKQALEAFEIRQMVRLMGANTAGTRALLEHARHLDDEGQQLLSTGITNDDSRRLDPVGTPVPSGARPIDAPAERGALTINDPWTDARLLSEQSREVVQALRALDADTTTR